MPYTTTKRRRKILYCPKNPISNRQRWQSLWTDGKGIAQSFTHTNFKRTNYPYVNFFQFSIVFAAERTLTSKEFDKLMQNYYKSPRPDLIKPAIRYLNTSSLLNKKSAQPSIIASFCCIFNQYEDKRKKEWEKNINETNAQTKSILNFAISNTPEKLFSQVKISPAKNDMNWGCYFATGNKKYLDNLINVLQYTSERENLVLFLTGSSAQWSFSSVIKQHESVKNEIEKIANSKDNELSQIAKEILLKEPNYFHEKTISILKKQKKAGVWK